MGEFLLHLTIKMNSEQEQTKQDKIVSRNKKITRITIFILFIVLVMIIGRLLGLLFGI